MAQSQDAKAVIQQAIEELKKRKQFDKDAGALIASLEQGLLKAAGPALEKMVEKMAKAVGSLQVNVPETKIPDMEVDMTPVAESLKSAIQDAISNVKINVQAPTVNVSPSEVKFPKFPDFPTFPEFPRSMKIDGFDSKNPMPVMLFGTDGKPLMIPMGSSGSRTNATTIRGILTPNGDSMIDEANNALNVSIVSGSISAAQASGAADSVNVIQFGGQDVALGSGVVNAGTLRVVQVSDVVSSVELASQPFSLDVRQVSGSISSVEIASQPFTLDVKQVSGSVDSVIINSSLVSFETKQVSGLESSVNVTQLGGNAINLGAGTVGTGTIRMVVGSDSTVMITGDKNSDDVDGASPPVKTGGIARTTNPTAVGDGDRVSATYDDLGRQTIRINQVRDLIQTAYATLSKGTETTLLASASGVFSDLIYIMAANDSSAAVQVDIRSATGANKVMTIEVPANGTAGVSLPVPLPQDVAASTWTVDMPDITGTNVYVSALFSKEV